MVKSDRKRPGFRNRNDSCDLSEPHRCAKRTDSFLWTKDLSQGRSQCFLRAALFCSTGWLCGIIKKMAKNKYTSAELLPVLRTGTLVEIAGQGVPDSVCFITAMRFPITSSVFLRNCCAYRGIGDCCHRHIRHRCMYSMSRAG